MIPIGYSLALGGADWTVDKTLRFSWYSEPAAFVLLLGSLLAISRTARPHRLSDPLRLAAVALFAVSSAILWTGGVRLAFVSMRSPDASAWLGAAALAAAFWGSWLPARPPSPTHFTAALVVGIGLTLCIVEADRLKTQESIHAAAKRHAELAQSDAGSADRPPIDTVWIVVDTLRADAIGAYRRSEALARRTSPLFRSIPTHTPNIDALATRGVVFERVMSTSPWTLPAMMSAMTSLYPSTTDPDGRGRARTADDLIGLDPSVPTWIDQLRSAGYHAVGFQKNPFLGTHSGFPERFDAYRQVGGDRAEKESGAQLVRAALRWADEFDAWRSRQDGREETMPYLLYLHFMEPHVDYTAPQKWWSPEALAYRGPATGNARDLSDLIAADGPVAPQDRQQLARLYSAEVAYVDQMIGELIDGLRDRHLLDEQTLIALIADHGEQFGEHGQWVHGDVHRENIEVPWILAGAGLSPLRLTEVASVLDLAPTLLDLVGVEALPFAEGRSRGPSLRRVEANIPVESEPTVTEYGSITRIVQDAWVLIDRGTSGVQLFDTETDPREEHDVSGEHPEVVQRLHAGINRHRARPVSTGVRPSMEVEVAPETRRALRALGYAED